MIMMICNDDAVHKERKKGERENTGLTFTYIQQLDAYTTVTPCMYFDDVHIQVRQCLNRRNFCANWCKHNSQG